MSGDGESSRGQTGLEDIHDESLIPEKTRAEIVLDKLHERWRFIGGIVVMLFTSGALYYVDGRFSLDALVFAVMALLMLVYFLVTLWSDLRLE